MHSTPRWTDCDALRPQAVNMTFSEAGPVPAQGNVAQQIFWYTAFTADMTKPGLPVVNDDGTPKWRLLARGENPVTLRYLH
jgi:glycerol transport system substrate-binding protein